MTDASIIEMKAVNKWYGTFQVLTDIDLSVRPGERIVVCGPSGSGKSTLIRCINRLETVQKGRIVVDGIDLTAALFSESTGRVIVSVPREDDVRFVGLCEGRGYPVVRIGVTDSRDTFELQDVFTASLDELREVHRSPLPKRFGATVGP